MIPRSGIDSGLVIWHSNHVQSLGASVLWINVGVEGILLATEAHWMFDATIQLQSSCTDPFNDVALDVVFEGERGSWRVPAFWRGGDKWGVRFAPPCPGEYSFEVVCVGVQGDFVPGSGRVGVRSYSGPSPLLRKGPLKISPGRRYFEHADGAAFYWLSDTWWSGLSGRLDWEGFQTLASDRKTKGFTAIHLCAGLGPPEEDAPHDPGVANEGGPAWEPDFARVNPSYFDIADRRIFHLVELGLVPVIVGGWFNILRRIGVEKMKQHWRYLIARYSALPVVWISGGEVYDPPESRVVRDPRITPVRGWTEVTRYVREIDPHRRPLSVHEKLPPFDLALGDDTLTDFEFIQPGHFGKQSVEAQVALLNRRYSTTDRVKPIVNAEVAYEGLAQDHSETVQRAAFWLAMLNGAAGHGYGAAPTFEINDLEKPFQRHARWSLLTWDEGMRFPGSTQVGMGASFLQRFEWWRFEPRPDWITPRGTTLLAPRHSNEDPDLGNWTPGFYALPSDGRALDWPAGEWRRANGSIDAPYAAGIEHGVRVIYIPCPGFRAYPILPTVLKLDPHTTYQVRLLDPVLGIELDMGKVTHRSERLTCKTLDQFRIRDGAPEELEHLGSWRDVALACDVSKDSAFDLFLRMKDERNCLRASFDGREGRLRLTETVDGDEVDVLTIALSDVAGARLTMEVRGAAVAAQLSTPQTSVTSGIEGLRSSGFESPIFIGGGFGQLSQITAYHAVNSYEEGAAGQRLIDQSGRDRGGLLGPGWEDLHTGHHVLLNEFRLRRLPGLAQDWVLILEPEAV